MNRLCTAFAVAVATAITGIGQAAAVPPTVTPSPGYDARLQEQRKANSPPSSTTIQPATPPAAPVPRHRVKQKH